MSETKKKPMGAKKSAPKEKKESISNEDGMKKPEPNRFRFPTMMLTESVFANGQDEPAKNFVAIPVVKDCPFIEMVFDPTTNMLAVISQYAKKQFQFVPKLDSNGLPKANSNKRLAAQFPQAQERILIDTYHEYYIRDTQDIEEFLKMHCINPEFNWRQYINLEVGKKNQKK